MPIFKITYSRTIYLTTNVEAGNADEARQKALALEEACKLGIHKVRAKAGSEVSEIYLGEEDLEVEPAGDGVKADFR